MKKNSALHEKPRLFFVIPSLMGGGAERVLISLANHFNQLNFQSVIISLNDDIPAYAIDPGVKVVFILKRHKNLLGYRVLYIGKTFYRLVTLLRKEKPVCVISFITSANIWTGIACNFTRTPYIVSERTSPSRSVNQFSYFHKHLAASIYKKAAAVVVSAKGVEDCLLENKSFKKLTNIHRITNAVTAFKSGSTNSVHNRRFILAVGRLTRVKGFDMLITAYSNANLDDVDLLIIGEGEERVNLVCQIHNMELTEKVILPGSKTNLQDYYSQAEIFVLPSRNEGYPNALVEAMSFGCPCIAFDCDFGPSEIITNDVNGILVQKESIFGLTAAIKDLVNNSVLKNSLGMEARNIINTNNPEKIFKDWENLVMSNIDDPPVYIPKVLIDINLH